MSEVSLDDNTIGDAGVEAIANACINHPSIRTLRVARNRISATGIGKLAVMLDRLPVTHLYIAGNEGLKHQQARTELMLALIVCWMVHERLCEHAYITRDTDNNAAGVAGVVHRVMTHRNHWCSATHKSNMSTWETWSWIAVTWA
jgi:hypothetical protein